jgi:hypothetical protein
MRENKVREKEILGNVQAKKERGMGRKTVEREGERREEREREEGERERERERERAFKVQCFKIEPKLTMKKLYTADIYSYLSISEQASIAKVIRAFLSSLCHHDFIQNFFIGSISGLAFMKWLENILQSLFCYPISCHDVLSELLILNVSEMF